MQGLAVQEGAGGMTIATVAADGLSVEERACLYSLSINGLLETRTLTPDPHATLHGIYLGPLHITFGELSPRVSRRTRALYARDRFDGIALQLVRAGRWHARIGSRTLAGEPGTLALFDFAQSFSMTDEADRSFVNVIIPRAMACRLADDPARLHGRLIDPATGGVLSGFLTGLVVHASSLKVEHGPALAEMLFELVVLAFRTEDDQRFEERRSPERRLRDRVERVVEMRLSASDLTPDWIARKLGVSRTDLYAAFSGIGGVARLIWDRRLAAARAMLLDSAEDRTIGAIALMFGFASDAHFSRAFKKQYGATPTAARQAAAQAA